MLKKKYYAVKYEINIIPFLDILLVLLLIFMISTPFITQSFEVNLPYSSYDQKINKNNIIEIIIEILGNNRYNMIVNHNQIKNISFDQIFSDIKLYNINISNIIFLIAAHKDISYNDVIKTLNFLCEKGVTTVNILTKPI